MMDRVQMHKDLCKELNDTYAKKNHDYGNSFGETFDKLGIISAITRISDKYNRLVSLCTKSEEERKVKDESITDTLLDMANYCIMTVIELHKDSIVTERDIVVGCNHDWRFETSVLNEDGCTERYRCERCGETKTMKVEVETV